MDPMQRWLLEAAYRALENGMFLYMYKESRVSTLRACLVHSWNFNGERIKFHDRGLHWVVQHGLYAAAR
jgi:hypothetical protein